MALKAKESITRLRLSTSTARLLAALSGDTLFF